MTDYLTPEEITQLQLKIKKASERAKELVAANAEEQQNKTASETRRSNQARNSLCVVHLQPTMGL